MSKGVERIQKPLDRGDGLVLQLALEGLSLRLQRLGPLGDLLHGNAADLVEIDDMAHLQVNFRDAFLDFFFVDGRTFLSWDRAGDHRLQCLFLIQQCSDLGKDIVIQRPNFPVIIFAVGINNKPPAAFGPGVTAVITVVGAVSSAAPGTEYQAGKKVSGPERRLLAGGFPVFAGRRKIAEGLFHSRPPK